MLLVLKYLLVVTLGVALGLAGTFLSVEEGLGFGAVRAGPWTGWPKTGSRDADPYARAARARSGEMPLGITEGLSFLARADDAGRPLDPRCDYVVSGATPAARFWTLTAMTPEGLLLDTRPRQYGFTSSEVVRGVSGEFAIAIASRARPGNWLPVAPDQPFILMLRVYDTTVSASASAIDASLMPNIRRQRCG